MRASRRLARQNLHACCARDAVLRATQTLGCRGRHQHAMPDGALLWLRIARAGAQRAMESFALWPLGMAPGVKPCQAAHSCREAPWRGHAHRHFSAGCAAAASQHLRRCSLSSHLQCLLPGLTATTGTRGVRAGMLLQPRARRLPLRPPARRRAHRRRLQTAAGDTTSGR